MAAATTTSVTPAESGALATLRPWYAGFLLSLCLALLGAFAAWMLSETLFDDEQHGYFQLSQEMRKLRENTSLSTAQKIRLDTAVFLTRCGNAGLFLGSFGLVVAALLRFAQRIPRNTSDRSIRPLLIAAAVGASFGILAACVQSGISMLFEGIEIARLGFAPRAIVLHANGWIVVGAGIGLALTLPDRRLKVIALNSAKGGIAGLAAALAYPLIAAVFFPLANSDRAIPTSPANRLGWMLWSAALIALAIPRPASHSSAERRGVQAKEPVDPLVTA